MEKTKMFNRKKKINTDENILETSVPLPDNEISPQVSEPVVEEKIIYKNNTMSKIQKIKKLVTKKNLLIALFVVLAVGFGYYFMQYRKLVKDPKAEAKAKTEQVIKKISLLAVIPNDPNAVLANVTDITKLKGQPFFNDAQNGDEIVIFPGAMRAVLYRPSINKIINIGPLSSSPNDVAGTTPSAATTPATTKTTTAPKTTTSTKTPAKTTTTKTPVSKNP